MALPTFDFGNIIKTFVTSKVRLLFNPITLFLVFSSSITVCAVQFFGYLQSAINNFPQIPSIDLTSLFDSGDSFLIFVIYLLDLDEILTLFNIVISFLNNVIIWTPLILSSLLAGFLVYRWSLTIRKSLSDWVSP